MVILIAIMHILCLFVWSNELQAFPIPATLKSSRTSQETHFGTAAERNRLMPFGETVAVYCENHTEHIDTLCGQNAEFWYVKAGYVYMVTTGL
jgi:hypothetical protein